MGLARWRRGGSEEGGQMVGWSSSNSNQPGSFLRCPELEMVAGRGEEWGERGLSREGAVNNR